MIHLYQGAVLVAHLSEAWARTIFSPFLPFGMKQQLAPWNSHRKGGLGQTEDPADQIWPGAAC